MRLYHGSPNKVIVPQYGLGEEKHDYGKGFYLTENVELAKEWAVCRPDETNGWVHQYELDTTDFYIAKEFVRDNIDMEILEELLSLGGLGIQFCLKSELAYSRLTEIENGLVCVEYKEFNNRYNERDINARNRMRELVDSDANKVTNVFSTLF